MTQQSVIMLDRLAAAAQRLLDAQEQWDWGEHPAEVKERTAARKHLTETLAEVQTALPRFRASMLTINKVLVAMRGLVQANTLYDLDRARAYGRDILDEEQQNDPGRPVPHHGSGP